MTKVGQLLYIHTNQHVPKNVVSLAFETLCSKETWLERDCVNGHNPQMGGTCLQSGIMLLSSSVSLP